MLLFDEFFIIRFKKGNYMNFYVQKKDLLKDLFNTTILIHQRFDSLVADMAFPF